MEGPGSEDPRSPRLRHIAGARACRQGNWLFLSPSRFSAMIRPGELHSSIGTGRRQGSRTLCRSGVLLDDRAIDDPRQHVCHLLLSHRYAILAYLRSFLHDYCAVEDVFQEISLIVIKRADQFSPGTSFRAWARTIARHKIREYLRLRRMVVVEEEVLLGMEQAFEHMDTGRHLEERKNALRRCVESLSAKARRLLSWRYEDGWSPEVIATKTQKTRTAVNSLLQRIREKLRSCVERRLAATGE